MVKMLMRKDSEISRFGHVIHADHGTVTGWQRLQKIVAEIQPGQFFYLLNFSNLKKILLKFCLFFKY